MFWFKKKMIKKKNYSAEEVKNKFDTRGTLGGYVENYARNPYQYMVLNDKGDSMLGGATHCIESTTVYANNRKQWKAKKRFIGITIDITDPRAAHANVRRASNSLHDTERELGFARHNLTCLAIPGTTSRVLWVFEIGVKWYTSPPMLALYLRLMRDGLKQENSFTHSNPLYELLRNNTPHGLFGGSRALNWGAKRKPSDSVHTAFSSVYGIQRLNNDLVNRNRQIIDQKFPKHKLFGD